MICGQGGKTVDYIEAVRVFGVADKLLFKQLVHLNNTNRSQIRAIKWKKVCQCMRSHFLPVKTNADVLIIPSRSYKSTHKLKQNMRCYPSLHGVTIHWHAHGIILSREHVDGMIN